VRVLELASERAAFAAKMLADLGADVVVVEPPGGHHTRTYGPFADDVESPERSLWWWHYNTSKRGIVLDLDRPEGAARFAALAGTVDIVVEGETPGRLADLGVDHTDVRAAHPGVIWVSVTPYGHATSRAQDPATDLTILAGGGPVWSCGYDDHTLPPVRGGGNQSLHIAGTFAVMTSLTALLARDITGRGQHVDVSMHAAANVTTEAGSYMWNTDGSVVLRQTGRHATPTISMPTQVQCADGRYVNTGFPPRSAKEMQALLDWLDALGLRDECPEAALVQLGVERGGVSIHEIATDDLVREIFGAGRETLCFIAERVGAQEYFESGQRRGIPCGIVASPDEAFEMPHFVERGFQVDVEHEELGRAVRYPGAPFKMPASPWRIARRAPHVGEHDGEVLGG
jgi:crotonobetainyl-CoA:carnitine CoA-transferase CaiB-like acyl-CoA transferase